MTLVVLQDDADLLFDMLTNLIDNAITFTPHGGTAMLDVATFAGQLQLVVANNGFGIAVEERDAVPRRFLSLRDVAAGAELRQRADEVLCHLNALANQA